MSEQEIKTTIAQAINQVRTDSGRAAIEISDEDTLMGTVELDSLDLAVLVVTLEQKLGVDPFREGARPVPTFGQFVQVYQTQLSK